MSDESTFLLNEATSVVEMDLHALLHNLEDWHQSICYGLNMHDVLM